MCDPVYEYPNAFFRMSDPHPQMFGDFEIPEGWWSRAFEYKFAMEYAKSGHICADMGCGWHYRPLHDALALTCDFVYGVDHHKEVLDLPPMKNGAYVVADFSKPIDEIAPASLDRIYCISVLEELINYEDAIREFKRLLKPDGLMVITCDVPYDEGKPSHHLYKGVKLVDLDKAIYNAGMEYSGKINRVKYDDLLHNDDFNLCVWHFTLRHRPERKGE